LTVQQTLQDLRMGNLILNPSFEIQHHTGFPDSYLLHYGQGGSVLSDTAYEYPAHTPPPAQPHPQLNLSPPLPISRSNRYAHTGYTSLRLVHPGVIEHQNAARGDQSDLAVSGLQSFLNSRVHGNATYTASVFARGDKTDLGLEITTCFGSLLTRLTTDWSEYRVVGSAVNNTLCSVKVSLVEQGTAWVDSISLWEGKRDLMSPW